MSQKSPPFEFATEYMLIKPKGPPFTFFGTMRHFLKEKIQKFQVFFQKKVFCAFCALDIAPTLDVPVLFKFPRQEFKMLQIVDFEQNWDFLPFF